MFGGLEPLHRYNLHKTEGFLIMKPLQSRYRGLHGVTRWPARCSRKQIGSGGRVAGCRLQGRRPNQDRDREIAIKINVYRLIDRKCFEMRFSRRELAEALWQRSCAIES